MSSLESPCCLPELLVVEKEAPSQLLHHQTCIKQLPCAKDTTTRKTWPQVQKSITHHNEGLARTGQESGEHRERTIQATAGNNMSSRILYIHEPAHSQPHVSVNSTHAISLSITVFQPMEGTSLISVLWHGKFCPSLPVIARAAPCRPSFWCQSMPGEDHSLHWGTAQR